MARKPYATLLIAAALATTMLAGCTTADDTLRLAFVSTDDDLSSDKDPQRLADHIEAATGRTTEIVWAADTQAVFEAMRAGQADAAFVDGAAGWFAWRTFGFEAVAADQKADGRTHYIAAAWVREDSAATSMEDLRGARSCHTGLLKSAGMFMPLGWLIENGLVDVQGSADDVASIRPTVEAFFDDPVIPEGGAPYSGYQGALQCLSEGVGDVAFIKDTTPATYCGGDGADWCLEGYREVQRFGQVPSHPVMVPPGLDAGKRADLVAGLLDLNENGRAILEDILETPGITEVTTEGHLGDYGQNIRHVPGIQTYVDGKLGS